MGNDGRLELSALVAQLRCRWMDLGFVNLTKLADLTKLDPEFRLHVWLLLVLGQDRRQPTPSDYNECARPYDISTRFTAGRLPWYRSHRPIARPSLSTARWPGGGRSRSAASWSPIPPRWSSPASFVRRLVSVEGSTGRSLSLLKWSRWWRVRSGGNALVRTDEDADGCVVSQG